MHEDDFAFLRAILQSPGDISTYQVYADWMDERNDLRAKFLRSWLTFREAAQEFDSSIQAIFDYETIANFEEKLALYQKEVHRVEQENAWWLYQIGEKHYWIDPFLSRQILRSHLWLNGSVWDLALFEDIQETTTRWVYTYKDPKQVPSGISNNRTAFTVHKYYGVVINQVHVDR